MDTKLILRMAAKLSLGGLLIGSAIGDFLSTRLTVDDFADEDYPPQPLPKPVPLDDPSGQA